jgi:hypothetical protein
MYVCGRKLVIAKRAKTQTVNVCTSANLAGHYDYRVRLPLPPISAETIAYGNFVTIHDFVQFLERELYGKVEQRPATQPADAYRAASLNDDVSSPERAASVSSEFVTWRDAWDQLGANRRISDVIDLWRAPVPIPWMRSESDLPPRLRTGERYTRANLHSARRGEHILEHQILVEHFASAAFLDQPLLDGVNAFPLVRDEAGGRGNDVESDLVLLTGKPESAQIFVCDVKVTDGDPWKALLQNLRQLRLFTSNPICTAFFEPRVSTAKVVKICGGVIAPDSFYARSEKGEERMRLAKSLSDAIAPPPTSITAELLVWDPKKKRISRRA